MILTIYEDRTDDFYPLINLYPQYKLWIGGRTIADHVRRVFSRFSLVFGQRQQKDIVPKETKGTVIYLSARCIPIKKPVIPRDDCALVCDGAIVGLVKRKPPYPKNCNKIPRIAAQMKRTQDIKGYVVNSPWDLIRYNAFLTELYAGTIHRGAQVPRYITVIGKKKHVCISSRSVIHHGVVLDVTQGPVIIDAHACIRPFTTIVGPSFIGSGTIIDRAKITASCIGPMCRIGGEVEASIFQGYANKYHEGFIGHSFVGEWVNLGALTTNSDLKNNYGPVRVWIRGKMYDTGMTKLGCFIGDHTKTGIGTLIPTGAVIGSFVNFFGGGMMSQFTGDFTWLTAEKQEVYSLKKALDTARIVMGRRGRSMSASYRKLIKDCYSWRNT